MYFRKISPTTMCRYQAASMLERSLSAAAQRVFLRSWFIQSRHRAAESPGQHEKRDVSDDTESEKQIIDSKAIFTNSVIHRHQSETEGENICVLAI